MRFEWFGWRGLTFWSWLVMPLLAEMSEPPYWNQIDPNDSKTAPGYERVSIGILQSVGMSDQMEKAARNSILAHYSMDKRLGGDMSLSISQEMEKNFGGYWTVILIDEPFDFYTTLVMRSRAFALFDVNGAGVFIGKDGGKPRIWNRKIIEYSRQIPRP